MLPTIALPQIDTGRFAFGSRPRGVGGVAPSNWRTWLSDLFPAYVRADFAPRHIELWDWFTKITPGVRPQPFVGLWPRGGAKSTSAELGAVFMGARQARRYIWYVSSTQEKADQHVDTIAALLESDAVAHRHPGLSDRMVGKYGNSKGWRRSRLRTASGLTVDALGLDTGARGAKVEDQRPDMIILDDVDDKHDTPAATAKKVDTITASILPAGSGDCAVLFVQNVIHPNSIAAQLADGRADFLADRIVSGPHPAVDGLAYELRDGMYHIIGGAATWDGQSLEICRNQIITWGLTAFLKEAQHEVNNAGGIWDHIVFRHCAWDEVPWGEIVRGCVWCDPAVTSTDQSCSNGIVADAITDDQTMYRLYSWEGIDTPLNVLKRSIRKAVELGLGYVGVETNQGGDLWRDEYQTALDMIKDETRPRVGKEAFDKLVWPSFRQEKAGTGTGGKVERNQRMLVDYERGAVVHVLGTHETLERALKRFPIEPLDLADAAFWGWKDLRGNAVTVIDDPFMEW
jgi:hypothetical protein